MFNKINEYQKFTKEINKMEKEKGIQARINPKAKRTKPKKRKK